MLRKLAIVLSMVLLPAVCFGLITVPDVIILCRGEANNGVLSASVQKPKTPAGLVGPAATSRVA